MKILILILKSLIALIVLLMILTLVVAYAFGQERQDVKVTATVPQSDYNACVEACQFYR